MSASINIKKLSHVGLNVQDIERQATFFTDMVGLGETARDEQGRVYLRCNSDHHQIILIPAAESGLNHYALAVGGEADLDLAMKVLDDAQIIYEVTVNDELGQGKSIRFQDPLGFMVELTTELEQVSPRYGVLKFPRLNIAHPRSGG